MATKTLLSLEEFALLPDDGMRHELDEGELIVMPPPKFGHTNLAARIHEPFVIYLHVQRSLGETVGRVFCEAGYLLDASGERKTVRQPDISYIKDEWRGANAPDAYIEGAPDLAIEIVSPSDTAGQIARKVSQYLAAGSRAVWVVYPDSKEVHVFRSGHATILAGADVLDDSELFPGWEGISLTALFQ